MSVVQFKADKGCFPLIKILHAERNLSLFVSFQAEKKAMKNSVPQNFKKQLIWQSIDLAQVTGFIATNLWCCKKIKHTCETVRIIRIQKHELFNISVWLPSVNRLF